ncbi:UDP-N-acetylmuramoyl-L-alanine--D-glutamate ligase [Candidatus Hepatincolaceae symbiont of Richtersius coronifer]
MNNKKVAILGLGISGVTTYTFLNQEGFTIYAWDDNLDVREKNKHLISNFVSPENWAFKELDFIFVSPGISLYRPQEHFIISYAKKYKIKLCCDIDIFMSFYKGNLNKESIDRKKNNLEAPSKAADNLPKQDIFYIGITGTNGKSTTTTLINHILNYLNKNACMAGNMGTAIFSERVQSFIKGLDVKPDSSANHPLPKDIGLSNYIINSSSEIISPKTSDFLDESAARKYLSLELSSYQLSLMSTQRIQCALILNLEPDHLEYHGDFQQYIKAKIQILKGQVKDDLTIISQQALSCLRGVYKEEKKIKDELEEDKEILGKHKILTIYAEHELSEALKSSKAIYIKANQLIDNYFEKNKTVLDFSQVEKLKGAHNHQNIAFAYAAVRYALFTEVKKKSDTSNQQIIEAIKFFNSLEHRQEYVRQVKNISFINDSKATNPQSTLQALKTFDNMYLILGGIQKTDNLEVLLPFFHKVRCVFLIGKSRDLFSRILTENNVKYSICYDLNQAVQLAFILAQQENCPSPVVLLSPACASFDMFKNFQHRGEVFKQIVSNL